MKCKLHLLKPVGVFQRVQRYNYSKLILTQFLFSLTPPIQKHCPEMDSHVSLSDPKGLHTGHLLQSGKPQYPGMQLEQSRPETVKHVSNY